MNSLVKNMKAKKTDLTSFFETIETKVSDVSTDIRGETDKLKKFSERLGKEIDDCHDGIKPFLDSVGTLLERFEKWLKDSKFVNCKL